MIQMFQKVMSSFSQQFSASEKFVLCKNPSAKKLCFEISAERSALKFVPCNRINPISQGFFVYCGLCHEASLSNFMHQSNNLKEQILNFWANLNSRVCKGSFYRTKCSIYKS